MKTEKNILIAFILNMAFAIFEIVGGIFTNSIAILSDAVHDFGDAISIGISYVLEKKSNKKPDEKYTYGYTRYSILGAFITTIVLIGGSCVVIYESIKRLLNPIQINYDGMIILAILGVVINFIAAYYTKEGDSLNQKSVNLHMIEDVLGWIFVLIGSIVMKFTNILWIDSIMSISVATFILIHAFKNLKSVLDLFLEKAPKDISIGDIKEKLKNIENVIDVHHIHLWSMNGKDNYATMHVFTNAKNDKKIKSEIRDEMKKQSINHVTIEIEKQDEDCNNKEC